MKARMEPNFQADGYNIWFLDDYGRVGHTDDHGWLQWDPVEPGAVPEPSLFLKKELFEALMLSGQEHVPETHAMTQHLKREIEMSDWMRAMVWKLVPNYTGE